MKQIEITVRLDEINSAKNNMFEEIKNTGINVTDEKDVKKAYELILKKYFSFSLYILHFIALPPYNLNINRLFRVGLDFFT